MSDNLVSFADEKLQRIYEEWRAARLEESRIVGEIQLLQVEIANRKAQLGQLNQTYPQGYPSSALFKEFTNRLVELVDQGKQP